MTRSASGAFIAFEGGEGAGKTTQIGLLADALAGRGQDVLTTREPGGTPLGGKIRELLLDPASSISPRAEALLFAADRADHVDAMIRPALAAGTVVITDRYIDSSLAYQGAGRALSVGEVRELSRWATDGLLPDLTVLLDIDPSVGLGRAGRRGAADRMETESLRFHEDVRQGFLALADADQGRYLVVDAHRPAADIAAEIIKAVLEVVGTE